MDDYLLSSNKTWREKNGNKMKDDVMHAKDCRNG
jgi:hypothetical protein